MALTVNEIIKQVAILCGLEEPTGTLYSSTDNNIKLIHLCLIETGRELRNYMWPQLKKNYSFSTSASDTQYVLPGDFYKMISGTQWDQTNSWRVAGPLSDQEMNAFLYGIVSSVTKKRFRIFGSSIESGQFFLDPIPEGTVWEPSTAYAVDTYIVNSRGTRYRCSVAGTSGVAEITSTGDGVTDGTVTWNQVTTWTPATAYSLNDARINNHNIYKVTTAGTSAAYGGPTGTGTGIIDNSVVWELEEALPVLSFDYIRSQWFVPKSWTASESVTSGSTYRFSNGNIYLAATTATTGSTAPSHTTGSASDGTVSWTYVSSQTYGTNDRFQADTDFPLIDDDLMVLGGIWRFKFYRGLDYGAIEKRYNQQRTIKLLRLNGAPIINMASSGLDKTLTDDNIPDGSFNV